MLAIGAPCPCAGALLPFVHGVADLPTSTDGLRGQGPLHQHCANDSYLPQHRTGGTLPSPTGADSTLH
jgi:hypothetical protein